MAIQSDLSGPQSASPARRRFTSPLFGLALTLVLAAQLTPPLTPVAAAALATDVADAGEEDNPIDVDIDARWKRIHRQARITREYTDLVDRRAKNVSELHYQRWTHVLDANLAVGLWRDLELHFNVPFAVADEQQWGYAAVDGVSVEQRSTIATNPYNAHGDCLDGTECRQVQPFAQVPGRVLRGGLMDPSVGISWAILNDHRVRPLDPSIFPPRVRAAALVVSFDYTAPLAPVNDPSKADPSRPEGKSLGLGAGTHRFTWSVAMSKRLGMFEPFLRFRYTLPVVAPNAYDNCSGVPSEDIGFTHSTEQMRKVCAGASEVDYWNDRTGIVPPHVGSFLIGTEIVPVDQQDGLRLALGVEGEAEYVSRGRYYSELSDVLGRLTQVDQHFVLDGRLFADFRFSKYAHLVASFTVGSRTPHFLTGESVGRDFFGEAGLGSDPDGVVSLRTAEVNPNYDFRWDQPGRRFRATDVLTIGVSAMASINF